MVACAMASMWTDLAIRWKGWTDPYDALEAVDPSDRAACEALITRVRRDELRRATGGTALRSLAFGDATVEPRVLAVRHRRSGRIVGCALGVPAEQLAASPEARAEYALDTLPDELLRRSGIATRFVVEPEHRRTLAGFALLSHYIRQGMAEGFELCLFACEPGLYRLYTDLGMRPIGTCHPSGHGGFRVPMALICHDVAHLERLGSPLVRAMPRGASRPDSPFIAWYNNVILADGPVDTGVRPYQPAARGSEPPCDDALTHGMSDKGRRAFLRGALVVRCRAGDVVWREGDGGRQLGVVLEGTLVVRRGERAIADLRRGDPFGELGWALRSPRSAGLVSRDDGAILLLSARAPERLRDPRDRECFWQNIAKVCAERLVATTSQRAEAAVHG